MTSEIDHVFEMSDSDIVDPWFYHERGWAYYEMRQKQLAIQDFDRAISLDNSEPEFWLSRGMVNEDLGHISKAREELDHAIKLDPYNARAYGIRGWFHKSNHKYEYAVADYDHAIDLNPIDSSYRCSRGLVLASMGELNRALQDFEDAIHLDPENASYYYERAHARLYYNSDVYPEDALSDLEEAIRLAPTAVWYRLDRGYILFYLRRWADAAEDFACQDMDYTYQLCPHLGAGTAIWLYLARLFQGVESVGLESLKNYLAWYSIQSFAVADAIPFPAREDWPVPLARFLMREIDELQLLGTPSLDLRKPGLAAIEICDINYRIMEYHFVVGELLLSQGNQGEAFEHLVKACFLPSHNPMSWIAVRQVDQEREKGAKGPRPIL